MFSVRRNAWGWTLFIAGCCAAWRPQIQAGPPPYINLQTGALIESPGTRADGKVLLHNQWSIKPAGRQLHLGGFTLNLAVHPEGRYAAVMGLSGAHVSIIDLQTERLLTTRFLIEGFYGLTFSPDGQQLYLSAARQEAIYAYDFAEGQLSNFRALNLRPPSVVGLPAGLVVSTNGAALYVANLMGRSVTRVNLAAPTNVTEMSLTNVAPGATNVSLPASDPYPYTTLVDEGRQRLYLSLWAHARVVVFDLVSGRVLAHWRTEEHPNELVLSPDGGRLYVANANRNTVTVFNAATGAPVETLSAALYPGLPPGNTPNSLALTPDGQTLFVANAGGNYVAAFEVGSGGPARALGFIPVGWYPTAVRLTPDGTKLLVANAKGGMTKPFRGGALESDPPGLARDYNYAYYAASLSIVDLPPREEWPAFFATNSATVLALSPIREGNPHAGERPPDSPIPAQPGDPCPIRYCIYIVKENRTYDILLGDMPEGNGDPALCLFGERVTPNHHKLAREFVLLDNFYVDALLSADGHEWTFGANCSDFVERLWRLKYNGAGGGYPAPGWGNVGGGAPDYMASAAPANGYLWDRAKAAGLSYRSYGCFTSGTTARTPALAGHFDTNYNFCYTDLARADRFISELRRFETNGQMPRIQFVWLPDDHTWLTEPGRPTPTASVAMNDLGLGRIVEAVSRSVFWPEAAIFVLEDDSAYGPDHVDCHRSPAFVISPYAKRRHVDSTMYSSSSMIRTIGLILGLEPLSQFDAAARPMYGCFQGTPDLTPYTALPAQVDLTETNTAAAYGAARSLRVDLSRVDAVDERLATEIIWRAVRGADAVVPVPVHAAFVRGLPGGDAEDDDDDRLPAPARPEPEMERGKNEAGTGPGK